MDWLILLTFAVSFSASFVSGMSGGGGGFFTVPYFIFIGLPPAHALATAKMGGVGTSLGAIPVFKGKGIVHKKLVVPLMAITFVCSLFAAWLIPRIDASLFTNVIGISLIVLSPTLFIKKKGWHAGKRSKPWIVAGFVMYTIFSLLQTIIGTGMGSILVLILIFLFGLSALESNATKRVAQSVQAILLFILLGIQGLVVWTHGVVALAGALLGSNLGARMAIKRGESFIRIVLAAVMVSSGIALLVM